MADPQAMEKLRAVLDYIPEEAARRLPGDPQDYYDALTQRLHRTVAVKTMVRRRVIVEQPDTGRLDEPDAPWWEPPAPPLEPSSQPAVVEAMEEAVHDLGPAMAEDVSVVEAAEAPAAPYEEPAPVAQDDDFFDVVKRDAGPMDMAPVEPDVSLSEAEWRTLEETPTVPEETGEAPAVAGEAEEEAFEEILLPAEGEALAEPAPAEAFAPPLETAPELPEPPVEEAVPEPAPVATAEFEVEEAGEVTSPDEFEVLEEAESEVEEGDEPPYEINEFTLYRREVRVKGGKTRANYFFAAEAPDDATPSPLPEGYEAVVNPATGIPAVRKSAARVMPVIEIEGIGPVMAERLEQAGVRTTKDLLRIDPRAVSAETGISERMLGNFRAMADLLKLPGVYPDQAAALVYAGCRSLADLNKAPAAELAKSVNRAAKDYNLQLRGKMTASRIKAWQNKIFNLQLVGER
jgi:hypothetical protein